MKSRCESCTSCGMPMNEAEEYALGDVTAVYCRYCTDSSGKLLPFEKILKSNTAYYMESQGISEQAALKLATDLLKSQPAWKNAGA